MTYSNFRKHSSPPFKMLNILKFSDFMIALLLYDYYTDRLPRAFSNFFEKVNNRHNYNTRLAAREYFLKRDYTNFDLYHKRLSYPPPDWSWVTLSQLTQKVLQTP